MAGFVKINNTSNAFCDIYNMKKMAALKQHHKIICCFLFFSVALGCFEICVAQNKIPSFKVIAFFTGKQDQAHISFVADANDWFPLMADKFNFSYDTSSNWNNLNDHFLSAYQVIIFLDTRPELPIQRMAFEKYMAHGGGWMGFHFAAFALTASAYPQNWNWYHNQFLGSGEYVSNTWRPTAAVLQVTNSNHPATKRLPATFTSAPNEWYNWSNDLRKNSAIKILAVIDSSSFPLGTGPKLNEIWQSGYYPVVWTNINYKMIYFNMGHNDMNYEKKPALPLSFSFKSQLQNQMIIDALLWLGMGKH